MTTRVESAAATRRALLDAATGLLDEGGPEAVTLREVGARAGVSRGAPYRHFADKDDLLTAIAAQAWNSLADQAVMLGADPDMSTRSKVRAMLAGMLATGRERPHLYRLMHRPPAGPEVLQAAGRSQGPFVAALSDLVGDAQAHRFGAVLLSGAHGAISMEASGQLTRDKWKTDADEILDTLVGLLPAS